MSYVELSLRLATPLFTGSVEPNVVDEEMPLRPSEVKGVWRWWARALIGGAMYDDGLLHGATLKGILKIPTRKEAQVISEFVGRDLGLGYVGSGGSNASCFRLLITASNLRMGTATSGFIRGLRLQRIQLLTLGRRSVGYVEQGDFQLTIDSHIRCGLSNVAITTALSSLALALNLSCFGKGGRRGLGCLDITRAYGSYSSVFDTRIPISKLLDDAVKNANDTVKKAESVVRGGSKPSPCELPPMPVISKVELTDCLDKNIAKNAALNRLFVFQVIEVRGKNLLPTLHNFFLRPERTKVIEGSPSVNDELRNKSMAWVLGLPREQRGTGYLMSGTDRRASPMLLSIHGAYNDLAYISVFVSADWPTRLTWRGAGSQNINVTEKDIVNASYVALNEYLEYLNKQGIQWRLVWPQ